MSSPHRQALDHPDHGPSGGTSSAGDPHADRLFRAESSDRAATAEPVPAVTTFTKSHDGQGRTAHWRLAWATALTATLLLGGCSSAAYYWQSVSGHLSLMQAARPVSQWLDDAQTPTKLRERLALATRIRRFAVSALSLPDNASYQSYADLGRSAAVWNVVAAPALSLTLERWCFPVTGCVSYKGYFNEAQARQEAAELAREGLDVSVHPVPAYSTLGWMNWAGGDPLLSTFIGYPEGELARLIFHELAHQVVFVEGDTAFNESFASAVERLGGERWLQSQSSAAAQQDYARYDGRRQQFKALALALRGELAAQYAAPDHTSADQHLASKQQALQRFGQQYAVLRERWGGYPGYDRWVAQVNNSSLGALAEYEDLVPGFQALFAASGQDWPRFYRAVRALADLPAPARHEQLRQWAHQPTAQAAAEAAAQAAK